jgi:hypothetical protein
MAVQSHADFFLLCVLLLSPWGSQIPEYSVIHEHLIWILILFGFSGLFVLFTVIEMVGKYAAKPLSNWRDQWAMDRKMKNLAADEMAILMTYLADGFSTRTILAHEQGSAVMSLVTKGILAHPGDLYENWTDKWTYSLTPHANESIRKGIPSFREKVR